MVQSRSVTQNSFTLQCRTKLIVGAFEMHQCSKQLRLSHGKLVHDLNICGVQDTRHFCTSASSRPWVIGVVQNDFQIIKCMIFELVQDNGCTFELAHKGKVSSCRSSHLHWNISIVIAPKMIYFLWKEHRKRWRVTVVGRFSISISLMNEIFSLSTTLTVVVKCCS